MQKTPNFVVATENRPYLPIDGLPGMSIKPMNALDKPLVWSAIIRVNAEQTLPKRQHSALCEMLVIDGNGKYTSTAETLSKGDYLREAAGIYESIRAEEDGLTVFVTHHGDCTFFASNGSAAFVASVTQIKELQKLTERTSKSGDATIV